MEIQVKEIRLPRELIPVEVRAYKYMIVYDDAFLADTMFDLLQLNLKSGIFDNN